MGRRFGSVTVTSANTVWFLAPFFDQPNAVRQAAAFKEALLQIPEAEVVLLYAQDEETAGDWNVALSDAKVSLQNIFYFTQDGTVLTHGLEQVPMDTVLLLAEQEEPVYEAPVTMPEEMEEVPVWEEPVDEPEEEPVQEEPVEEPEEPEEELILEEPADEPEEEPVPEESAGEPEEEPVQEEPVVEPEEEPVPEEPAEEPEEEPIQEEAPAAPAKVPIDLSSCRNCGAGQQDRRDNGIFKGHLLPWTGRFAGRRASSSSPRTPPQCLLYARSLVRCAPCGGRCIRCWPTPTTTRWRTATTTLSTQTVYEDAIPGCSAETAFRFHLCAFLRMLFADEIDPSSAAEGVHHRKLLPGLCPVPGGGLHLHPALPEGLRRPRRSADQRHRRRRPPRKASLPKRASELLDLPLQECHSPHPRSQGIAGEAVQPFMNSHRPVADDRQNHLEEGLAGDNQTGAANGGTRRLNDLIDKLWAETSTLNSAGRRQPLLNSQRSPSGTTAKFIDVFLHWAELARRNNESDAYLIARNRMLNSLNELDGQIAQLDKERLGGIRWSGGPVRRHRGHPGHPLPVSSTSKFFYLDFVTNNQVELDFETTLPLLDESVSILPRLHPLGTGAEPPVHQGPPGGVHRAGHDRPRHAGI